MGAAWQGLVAWAGELLMYLLFTFRSSAAALAILLWNLNLRWLVRALLNTGSPVCLGAQLGGRCGASRQLHCSELWIHGQQIPEHTQHSSEESWDSEEVQRLLIDYVRTDNSVRNI
jgi:hypothetical protein